MISPTAVRVARISGTGVGVGEIEGDGDACGDTTVSSVGRATAEAAEVPFFVVPWGGGPGVSVAPGHRLTRLGDLLQQGRNATAAG